ncbi:MAG TPA: hypothetical protein VF046_08065 [Gemmatimonadales bacterium]
MTVPSRMSLRRIPEAMHLPVRVAYAASWEALIDIHTREAHQFVGEFAPRIPALEALDLYFRVTAVPESMHEVVRSRALTALNLKTLPSPAEMPVLTGWARLRLDLLLEYRRYRRRHLERTIDLARMAGARASEAVIGTHVENALELAWLLRGVMPVNAAADHYVREFGLAASAAQMVMQRVQARVASDELAAEFEEPPPRLEAVSGVETAPAFPEPAAGGV